MVWCGGSLYTWTQLVGEGLFGVVGLYTLGLNWGCLSALGMSIFLNRFYWFGAVVLCILGLN